MNLLEILNTLPNVNSQVIQEDFSYCNIEIQLDGTALLSDVYTIEFINSIFNNVPSTRDTLKVFINFEGESIVTFRDRTSINSILSEYDSSYFQDEYTYTLKLQIDKQISNVMTIYSFDNFVDYLTSGSTLKATFNHYKVLSEVEGQIYFHIQDSQEINFCTKRFLFSNVEHNTRLKAKCSIYPNKNVLLDQQKAHCFVSGESAYAIIPDDFYLVTRSTNEQINTLFDKLCMLLVLTFLTDISEYKDQSIYYKLYGYKTISNDLTLDSIKIDYLEKFYKVYTWIFQDNQQSTISDKLGMARNLITLHLKNHSLDEVEGDVFTAVKSNFDIYLKENVQRYLEVKNQVSAFIYDMSLKAESSADLLATTFKSNLLIFISYFISIIVVKAIDDNKFANVFTFEVTSITLLFLLISWLYKRNLIADIKNKKNRFHQKYLSFKKRYSDILDETNLESIFGEDKDHANDIKYINGSIIKYNKLWSITVIAFSILTVFLCITHDTSNCFTKLTQSCNSLINWYLELKK